MAEERAFENGRISDFQGLVTLTLDRVILHTIMHHSSTSTYIPNFIEIEETFCGRTDVRTYRQTFYTHCIRATQRSQPKNTMLPGSPAVTNVQIVPKICQGQPPTMYSECSRFHPNRFTFSRDNYSRTHKYR